MPHSSGVEPTDSQLSRNEIVDLFLAALSTFDDKVHHGQIIVHIGEGDYEVEVNRRYKKIPRVRVTKPPTWETNPLPRK